MNEPLPVSPRIRLQALLAIQERERTDEQWDEINELEISLHTAVNREDTLKQGVRRHTAVPAAHSKPEGGTRGRRSFIKNHKRSAKVKTP